MLLDVAGKSDQDRSLTYTSIRGIRTVQRGIRVEAAPFPGAMFGSQSVGYFVMDGGEK